MLNNRLFSIAGSVLIMTPLLSFASPAIAAPNTSSTTTTTNVQTSTPQSTQVQPVSSSANNNVPQTKERVRRVDMLQCKDVRNTKRGGFQCVSPKKVKVRAKLGSANKPTEVLLNKKWVKTPYLWNKKNKALVLNSGMVPWVESLNSTNSMSKTYLLPMVQEDNKRAIAQMRVKSDGWGLNPVGSATNYKWDTKLRSFKYVKPSGGSGGGSGGGGAKETGTSPEAPTGLVATPKDSSVELSWKAPTRNGGSEITSYEVSVSPNAGTVSVNGTTALVSGLLNGTQYSFTVKANNGVGSSPASNPAQATPMTTPSAPTGLVAKAERSGEIRLSWNPNPSIEGVQNYIVSMDPMGADTEVSGTTAVIKNLILGRTYEFSVKAVNPIGTSAPSGKVAEKAIAIAGQVSNLTARAGESRIGVSWEPPLDYSGAEIVDYNVFYSGDGGETWAQLQDDVSPVTQTVITGLENGTTYHVTVTAITGVGAGATAVPTVATPYTSPDAPVNVVASPRDGGMHLSWDEPIFNGGKSVDYYSLSYSANGLDWTEYSPLSVAQENSSVGAETHGTIFGLTNGTEYLFRVVAGNDVGESDPSEVVAAVPASVPNAPRNVDVVANEGSLSVSWDEPDWDGGTTLGAYEVGLSPLVNQNNITITGRTAIVSGLTNGTEYQVFVRATNSQGASATSEPVLGTPYTTPDAPTNLVVVEDSTALEVSWTAPAFNGGHAITDYLVSVSPAVGTVSMTSETSARITGLQNGRNYYISVKSVNPRGESPSSETVVGVPRTTPSAPMTVVATPGDAQVQLSWNPPADNGGAVVEGYNVQIVPKGGANISISGTSATITGLQNGYGYYFTVSAYNEAGEGPVSMLVSSVPRTVPDAPTAVVVSPHIEKLAVSWSAPQWNGGQPVNGYEVRVTPAHGTITMTGEYAAEVTGLSPDTNYLVSVRASNVAGWGNYTDPVLGLTPPAAPEFSPEEQVCEQFECAIAWNEPSGGVGYEVYRDGILLGTVDNGSFADPTTLDAETVYTYTIVPLNGLGTPGAATEIQVLTKPADPQLIAGPDYIVSSQQVEVVVAAPKEQGGVTYDTGYDDDANALGTNIANISGSAVLARGLSGFGLGDSSTKANSVTCTGATCTLRWNSFLDKLGTKWFFALQPRNATGTSQQLTITRPAPVANDINWSIFETHYYCPPGYPTDMGNNTCRNVKPYQYYTTTYQYACGSGCGFRGNAGSGCEPHAPGNPDPWCVGEFFCYTNYCTGYSTAKHACSNTSVYGTVNGQAYSDSGSNCFVAANKIDYKTYEVKTSYAWNNTNAATTFTGDFVVNRVGLERTVRSGQSGNIGDCPGTVTVEVRGIGGSTTRTFGTPCTPAPNISVAQVCPFGYSEFGSQCRKTAPYAYDEQDYTYSGVKEYANYTYTTPVYTSCFIETGPHSCQCRPTDWTGNHCPYGGTMHDGCCLDCGAPGYWSTCFSHYAKDTTPPPTTSEGTNWIDNGTRWERTVLVKDATPSGWTDDGSKWIKKSDPPTGFTDDGTQYVSIVSKESQTVFN
jgi:hypothetical protein